MPCTCERAGDAARRAEAGVPAELAFATKPKLGRAMLERAFRAGVPCSWVTGDSVYGGDYSLRRGIERERRGYVLAVTSAERLGFKPVADWLGLAKAGLQVRLNRNRLQPAPELASCGRVGVT